ncbi:MAG: DUF1800 domain-containing protein [Xanthomonadaceae bacterium]|jgi:uncharacterized protein (DUF1800 family)|nr:DUF1800 domain-containing protein [Xanthomonadaceae bacterium]
MSYFRVIALLGVSLAALACGGRAVAQGTDNIFANGFEVVPVSEAEAARFLNQATFGANAADIAAVRNLGYSGWIDQQFGIAPTSHRRALELLAVTLPANTSINRDDRMRQWHRAAVLAPDQLRQRLAFALSQILVVSDDSDALSGEPLMVAEWNDMLARHAFGNYRDLLEDVTRSPAMGRYLTSLRNRKFEGSVTPDENYAREIMQLFSIGLFERELDYAPILVGGNPVPTYNNDMIAALSRVFTGMSYACTATAEPFPGAGFTIVRNCGPGDALQRRFNSGPSPNLFSQFFNDPPRDDNANNLLPNTTPLNRGLRHPDFFAPMVCYPRYHDAGRQANNTPWTGVSPQPTPDKTLVIAGQTLRTVTPISQASGTTQPTNCNTTGSPTATVPYGLDDANRQACVNYCESNIDGAVDMLFAHPNTSSLVARQLIQRFVTSNPSPAYVRRVACAFEGTSAQAGECTPASNNPRGDMRAVIRAVLLDVEARRPFGGAGIAANFGKAREPILKLTQFWRSMGATMPPLTGRNWGPTNPQTSYAQRPLGAPSVFNFYEPDYKQAGPISLVDINGNPSSTGLFSPEFQILNEVSVIDSANDLFGRVCAGYGGNNCNGAFAATPPTDRAYVPPANLDALPIGDGSATSDAALIEALNVRLMGGTMSGTIDAAAACPAPGASPTLTATLGSGMKGRLYGMLRCTAFNTLGATQDNRRRKALLLSHLILISPEFNTQR